MKLRRTGVRSVLFNTGCAEP